MAAFSIGAAKGLLSDGNGDGSDDDGGRCGCW